MDSLLGQAGRILQFLKFSFFRNENVLYIYFSFVHRLCHGFRCFPPFYKYHKMKDFGSMTDIGCWSYGVTLP